MTEAEREARDRREDKLREKKLKEQRYNDKEELIDMPTVRKVKVKYNEPVELECHFEYKDEKLESKVVEIGVTATGTEGNMNDKPYTVPLEVVKPD